LTDGKLFAFCNLYVKFQYFLLLIVTVKHFVFRIFGAVGKVDEVMVICV